MSVPLHSSEVEGIERPLQEEGARLRVDVRSLERREDEDMATECAKGQRRLQKPAEILEL